MLAVCTCLLLCAGWKRGNYITKKILSFRERIRARNNQEAENLTDEEILDHSSDDNSNGDKSNSGKNAIFRSYYHTQLTCSIIFSEENA